MTAGDLGARAFFEESDGVLIPLEAAASNWDNANLRGPAITGALARAAERLRPLPGMRVARANFELFRAARFVPSQVSAELVRLGTRLALIDAFLTQGSVVAARAHVLFLAEGENPGGHLWSPREHFDPPDPGVTPDIEGRIYRNGADWSSSASQDLGRQKLVWQQPLTVVAGEMPTPFTSACVAGDLTSLVVHWGTGGVEFINADVSIAMHRTPVADGIGLAVNHRGAHEGISAGSAVLFDRQGSFGTSSVVAVANAEHAVGVGTTQDGST